MPNTLFVPETNSKLDVKPTQASIDLAQLAMDAALDKKATDVISLFVGPYLVVTDYFVIATGGTDRQVAAIVDSVEKRLRDDAYRKPVAREGDTRGSWVLLDYGDIVVHVFQPEQRDEYRLERLWGEADRLKPAPHARETAVSGEPTTSVAAPVELESTETQ